MNAIPCPTQRKAALKKIEEYRTAADDLFVMADQMERFRRANQASGLPERAAAWQRIANVTRTEAENFVSLADKLAGQSK
ncbi:hypothetical protein FKW31_10000 [Acetobacter sp. DmW_136]|uniref:Uncharacterized protein n=1 Tax=Acetobacter pomorum TaxID=65959 RepID=A0A2G4RF35_9PROT|nr:MULTISPECIES: hypothetical protein [Acetobacter]KAA8385134.1 hypothetical protein FKW31_10000 [Acetobacter sp. DmW_136]PHY95158.1 hypothetical protein CSR02_02610 [Acetobacter pomorum]GBR49651.1 hypothetical protein AA11825_1412 [Acetobacter pomorum DSM 11825]